MKSPFPNTMTDMKKIVAVALLIALIGGAYFFVKRNQSTSGSGETSEKTLEKDSPEGASPGSGTDSLSGSGDGAETESPAPGTATDAAPGTATDAAPGTATGIQSGTSSMETGGTPAEAPVASGGKKSPAQPGSSVPWIQGSVGLQGDHVNMVDRFVSAIEERNPETMTRFFSKEMKSRSSVAGKGKLKSFIKQVLMGEGFFGGLTNPDTRKIRSVQAGVFHFTVKYEVSDPQNDEVDIPVTVKFQFEKIDGSYLITQVLETRG
jgi:hypothetical protein